MNIPKRNYPVLQSGLFVLLFMVSGVFSGVFADTHNNNSNLNNFLHYNPAITASSGAPSPIFQLIDSTQSSSTITNQTIPLRNEIVPICTPITPAVSQLSLPDMELILNPGWNFIATPAPLQSGKNTFEIFSGVDTKGHSIYRYLSHSGWTIARGTEIFKPFDGIWIYSVLRKSIPLYFDLQSLNSPDGKVLYKGWNAIGLNSKNPGAATDALSSVSDKWSFLISYNSTTQTADLPIIKGWTDAYSDHYVMVPGKGYWLYVGEDGFLSGQSQISDRNVSGTVDYKTETDDGWKFTIPGTVKGSLSVETGIISIESSDAFLTYGGKKYPLMMNIQAQMD